MPALFVYGTLKPNEVNAHFLEKLNGIWFQASLSAKLYEQGIGPTTGYKVVDLSQPVEQINGWVFQSDELIQAWPELDEFEGDGYVRAITQVVDEHGRSHQVFVYALDEQYFHLRETAIP